MKKFKQFFDEYRALHKPQREYENDIIASLSPQVKDFILSNNLKYNKRTNSFDTEGNVRVYEKDLIDGHLPIQLGVVSGHLEFIDCQNLNSLKNCPKQVGKNFSVYHSKNLTSLAGGPEKVGYIYDCSFTSIKNLEGIAKYIGQSIWCNYCNNLTTLNGLGQVEGKIICQKCPNLKITDQEREQYNIVEKVM